MTRLRQEIMNNVTHELRTPMGILLNTLELSFKNRFNNQEEEKEFITRALSNVHLLRGLIDDLLFLTNLDQGKVNTFRQKVDINYDIYEPAGILKESHKVKNIDLSIIIDPQMAVNAPRHEFKQAFIHLLDNAIKFSPSFGKVSVDGKPNGKGGCIILLHDEGPGISPVLREKVFERFYQVSQGDARLFSGLGLGLTISREVARSLGGDVTILDSDSGCLVQMAIGPGEDNWKELR
jgi:signal transduction histidine kinase